MDSQFTESSVNNSIVFPAFTNKTPNTYNGSFILRIRRNFDWNLEKDSSKFHWISTLVSSQSILYDCRYSPSSNKSLSSGKSYRSSEYCLSWFGSDESKFPSISPTHHSDSLETIPKSIRQSAYSSPLGPLSESILGRSQLPSLSD